MCDLRSLNCAFDFKYMMGDNAPVYRNLQVYLDHGVRRVTLGKILVYADDTVIAAGEGSALHLASSRCPTLVVPKDARKDARVVFWGDGEEKEVSYLGVKIGEADA